MQRNYHLVESENSLCVHCGELLPSPHFRSDPDGGAGWFPDADFAAGICSMCGSHHGLFLPVKKAAAELAECSTKEDQSRPLIRIYHEDFVP